MKNLLTLCLMILTFVSYSQTPKFITVKQFKNGVLVSTKSYPLVNKVEVTKVKYIPVKSKQKVKVVKLVDTLQVEKLVVDNRKVDSLNSIINNMSNEFAKVTTQKGTYTLEKNQGTVVVEEKVSNNQIIGRTFSADVKPQVKEKIVEVYRPKTVQWFLGPSITTRVSDPISQPLQSINLSLLRKGLGDNMLQLSIGGTIREGYMEPKPIIGFGYLLKIK
jgi:Flp pilus assembly secretin CpaC